MQEKLKYRREQLKKENQKYLDTIYGDFDLLKRNSRLAVSTIIISGIGVYALYKVIGRAFRSKPKVEYLPAVQNSKNIYVDAFQKIIVSLILYIARKKIVDYLKKQNGK